MSGAEAKAYRPSHELSVVKSRLRRQAQVEYKGQQMGGEGETTGN